MKFEAAESIPYSVVIPTRGQPNDFVRIAANFAGLPATTPLLVVANRAFTPSTAGIMNRPNTRIFFIPGGGVSRARNLGMWVAETDIVVFIDDDVWLDIASLQILVNRLHTSAASVVTARVLSLCSDDWTSTIYRDFFSFDRGDADRIFAKNTSAILTPTHAWSMGVGAVFAVKLSHIRKVPQPPLFDETLSNGRFCGGAEDVDFFLQCLQANLIIEYCARAKFPHQEVPGLSRLRTKMIQYARADGALYAKWRSTLSMHDVLADIKSWAKRVKMHAERHSKGEISLPMVALLREPIEKAIGALWWNWTAS